MSPWIAAPVAWSGLLLALPEAAPAEAAKRIGGRRREG
jgi:hypothetical protein